MLAARAHHKAVEGRLGHGVQRGHRHTRLACVSGSQLSALGQRRAARCEALATMEPAKQTACSDHVQAQLKHTAQHRFDDPETAHRDDELGTAAQFAQCTYLILEVGAVHRRAIREHRGLERIVQALQKKFTVVGAFAVVGVIVSRRIALSRRKGWCASCTDVVPQAYHCDTAPA